MGRRAERAARPDERSYLAIRQALDARALPPGTKLPEIKLAVILGVSRERVRKALHRLAHENRLELIEMARQPERVDRAALRRHLDQLTQALDGDEEPRLIAMSEAFHVLLARMLGNTILANCACDFLARSTPLWSRHAQRPLLACGGPLDHFAIADAIVRGDAALASRLMEEHIRAGARSLDQGAHATGPVDPRRRLPGPSVARAAEPSRRARRSGSPGRAGLARAGCLRQVAARWPRPAA